MIKHMTKRETLHFLRRFGAEGYGLLHLLGQEFDADGYFNDADLRLLAEIWGAKYEGVKEIAEFANFIDPDAPAPAPGPEAPRPSSDAPADAPAEGEGNSPDPADVISEGPAQAAINAPAAPQAAKRGRKPKAATQQPPALAGRLPLDGMPLAAIEAELTSQIETNDYVLFQKTGLKPEEAKKFVKEFILERQLSNKEPVGAGQLFLHFCYWKAKKPAPPAAVIAAESPRAAEQTPDGKPTTAAEYARQVQEAFDKMDELDRKYHPEDYVND